jgi:hypothetical protein
MNRILLGLATAAGLSFWAGLASADPGGFAPPGGPGGSTSLPSWAQIAGPNTLFGAGDLPPGRAPDRYGLHPCIKKFFHVPTSSGPGGNSANWAAAGYGMGGPAYNPMGYPGPNAMMGQGYAGPGCAGPGCAGQAGYPGYPPQGTLVFPYNNLIRSPRDYFMVDVNK